LDRKDPPFAPLPEGAGAGGAAGVVPNEAGGEVGAGFFLDKRLRSGRNMVAE
jgi:hypothetical protein